MKGRDREALMYELPELAAYIFHGYSGEKNMEALISSYLPAAGTVLKRELELLLADIKTGNLDQALLAFDLRCNTAQLSHFLTVLRGVVAGENSPDALDRVAGDITLYEQEQARRKAGKIPGKIERAGFFVVVTVALYMLTLFILVVLRLGSRVV